MLAFHVYPKLTYCVTVTGHADAVVPHTRDFVGARSPVPRGSRTTFPTGHCTSSDGDAAGRRSADHRRRQLGRPQQSGPTETEVDQFPVAENASWSREPTTMESSPSSHRSTADCPAGFQACPHHKIQTSEKYKIKRKKRSEMQTLHTKNFRPAADPLPGGAGRPKFNQLETVTTCTYRPSLVNIDARNFGLSWQQTLPARHKHTHRQDRLQYTVPLASTQCNKHTHTHTHTQRHSFNNHFPGKHGLADLPHLIFLVHLFPSCASPS